MTQMIVATITGILLYLLADWILGGIEHVRGRLLPHRSLFFFGIIFFLALITFEVMKQFLPAP